MSIIKSITPPIIYDLAHNFRTKDSNQPPQKIISGTELIDIKRKNIKGIFMHIHKCAGTSLIQLFEKYPEIISCVARPGNFPKRTGRELIPDDLWNKSFKFTFVRNPYARIVSAYLMFTTGPKWKEIFPEFQDFVYYLKWSDVQHHQVYEHVEIGSYVKKIDNIVHHCSSFNNHKYKLDEMDFIGKVENMETDIVKIASFLNIELDTLPHHNKHNKKYSYRDYYNDTTKQIISELYESDIMKFGYEF